MTITGFVGVILLTASMKRRPFRISSTYRMMAFVAGSVPVHRIKSSKVRSSWLPTDITAENPISSGRLQSTIVVMIAPLWEINAMEPGRGETGSNVVLIPKVGSMNPRQLGPMTRTRTFVQWQAPGLRVLSRPGLSPGNLTRR